MDEKETAANSVEGPFNSHPSIKLLRRDTIGERPKRHKRNTNEYKNFKAVSGHDIWSRTETMDEDISTKPQKENEVEIRELEAQGGEFVQVQNLPQKPQVKQVVVTSHQFVDVVGSSAVGFQAAEEVTAEDATLQALSLLPEAKEFADKEEVDDTEASMSDKERESFKKVHKSTKPVDFLILGVHGIGAEPAALAQNKKDLEDHMKFIQSHWFWEVDFKTHVELIDWKSDLVPRQKAAYSKILPHVDRYKKKSPTLSTSSVESPSPVVSPLIDPRTIFTDHVSDLLSFMTPYHGDFIVESVAAHLNHTVEVFKNHPKSRFSKAKIILVGHSLGGIILYELLTGERLRPGQKTSNIPKLNFQADFFFMWGVPLAAFCTLHDPDFALHSPVLPSGIRVFNIFHPCDPIGFRFEPLFYPGLDPVPPPVRLPHWKTNGPKEYFQWESDFANAKKLFAAFWNTSGQKFRKMLGQDSVESRSKLTSYILELFELLLALSTSGQEQVTESVYDAPTNGLLLQKKIDMVSESSTLSGGRSNRSSRRKISAQNRYGTHDRKITTGAAGVSVRRSTLGTRQKTEKSNESNYTGYHNDKEHGQAVPPWLGKKRKPATLHRLMDLLNIPKSQRRRLLTMVTTGGESSTGELLSEVEEGGGLELPVRLDFALQEELTERYISQLGVFQSHFNYWLSRDVVFFMLKEITTFRPRLSYPDFLRILKFAEEYENMTTQIIPSVSPEESPDRSPGMHSVYTDIQSSPSQLPKRLPTRTLGRPSMPQDKYTNAIGEGAEQGKSFFG